MTRPRCVLVRLFIRGEQWRVFLISIRGLEEGENTHEDQNTSRKDKRRKRVDVLIGPESKQRRDDKTHCISCRDQSGDITLQGGANGKRGA